MATPSIDPAYRALLDVVLKDLTDITKEDMQGCGGKGVARLVVVSYVMRHGCFLCA